jgi:hypothetical protein
MGREVTFKLRHYRKMMGHFVAPESRLRLASGDPPEPTHFHNRDLHSEERIRISPPSAPFRLRRRRIAI